MSELSDFKYGFLKKGSTGLQLNSYLESPPVTYHICNPDQIEQVLGMLLEQFPDETREWFFLNKNKIMKRIEADDAKGCE